MLLCYCRSPHSGTVDTDSTGMLHAERSLHDADTGNVDGLTAAADAETSAAAAACTESDTPSVARQSAVYEEPGEDGRPVYRGFQDPKSQSLTFKKLQSFIESESGEGKRFTAENHFHETISNCIKSCHENVRYKLFIIFTEIHTFTS